MRRPVLPTSASALFYTKVCFVYLRYALTFLLGMSGRRHLRRPLCLCAWTQQGVSFHPLWSLCLMFLLRACVPQRCKVTSRLLTCFVNGMLDSAADISRLQNVRKQKSLVHPLESFLSCIPQIRQTDCVHILWDGMETDVADQLGIHDATNRM